MAYIQHIRIDGETLRSTDYEDLMFLETDIPMAEDRAVEVDMAEFKAAEIMWLNARRFA